MRLELRGRHPMRSVRRMKSSTTRGDPNIRIQAEQGANKVREPVFPAH